MPAHPEYLTVRELYPADAADVSRLFQSQPPAYARFFYAFDFAEAAIAKMLTERDRDMYTGIYWQGAMIAVSMLRGWDAGYAVPAFGVLVDEKYRGGAFMRLALDMAKLTCRLCGAPRLMAKVHPDNTSPRGMRRLGFTQTGVEAQTGNIIYHYEL